MKTKIINKAVYACKIKDDFVSICETCKIKNKCDEPTKELRLTCPYEIYNKMEE